MSNEYATQEQIESLLGHIHALESAISILVHESNRDRIPELFVQLAKPLPECMFLDAPRKIAYDSGWDESRERMFD